MSKLPLRLKERFEKGKNWGAWRPSTPKDGTGSIRKVLPPIVEGKRRPKKGEDFRPPKEGFDLREWRYSGPRMHLTDKQLSEGYYLALQVPKRFVETDDHPKRWGEREELQWTTGGHVSTKESVRVFIRKKELRVGRGRQFY